MTCQWKQIEEEWWLCVVHGRTPVHSVAPPDADYPPHSEDVYRATVARQVSAAHHDAAPAPPSVDDLAARLARNRAAVRAIAVDLAARLPAPVRTAEEMDRILARWHIACQAPRPVELRIYASALVDPAVWRAEWGERGVRS